MPNRLKNETSPYLRQHMDNPVDWFPWCDEAFDKAKRENKPVFLSVGYSTCHWCHVMAHESFENAEVAEILNRSFVPIKVDREERPDVDSVYMHFCVGLNGSGGWPLNVIMTPDGRPFYAASYIPRETENGRAGLIPLLKAVALKWRKDRKELIRTAAELTASLAATQQGSAGIADMAVIDAAVEQLKSSYDEEYGGFGTAPKFPAAHNLIFLLRAAAQRGDKSLRAMVDNTLRQMYRGGIYDHIGGGFCRYSTDREWLAPHFEKTLYDNALLALCYTEAWQDGRLALYRDVAESTLDYCLRELKQENGGFAAAQDADSGGREGAYYFFTEKEVSAVIGAEGKHFCECYDITAEGNFNGDNIPNLLLNNRWNLLPEGYGEFREKLRIYRDERMKLGVDDKILTAWNGLMLMALSRAAFAFKDKRYLNEAQELAAFMGKELYYGENLMACLCKGKLSGGARLDDYVFYALGLLELYAADYDAAHLEKASALAEEICAHFADNEGGYYLTADDAEALVIRPKERFDGAMPCGNSACAVLFDLLGRYTGAERWRGAEKAQLRHICGSLGQYPAGCTYGLIALLNLLCGTTEIVCASLDGSLPATLSAVTARYAPDTTVLLKTPANSALLSSLAPFTADMQPQNGKSAYYVCRGGSCSLPIADN